MPVSLPTEIFLMIIKDVSSPHDLLHLRPINKVFCAAATPRAFRIVGATNRRDSALGLASLLQSDVVCHVREVVYLDDAADEKGNKVDTADRAHSTPSDVGYGLAVEEPLVEAFSLAASVPGITTLRFIFPPVFSLDDPDPDFDHLNSNVYAPLHLQHAILNTIGGAAPHLRVLTLTNVAPVEHELYQSPALHRTLSSLTHLRFSIAFQPPSQLAMPRMRRTSLNFWRSINQHVLRNLVDVVSLAVLSDQKILHLQFAFDTTYHRLKYLTLRNVAMIGTGGETGEDRFVRLHGETLEWIDTKYRGGGNVRWVRHTHADPQDESEYEIPPSMAQASGS
ncbi:hypothetical protein FA95DRAFT_1611514 [Auriscalpium vulgare]|uniref:Uncharacterized protein n=1 Tax=Auriscalpium vulgare TaxID=40419 RepID=A0ACB8R9M3_9AGAM|nr:hypothetical protein FA95DRAFT_1611514 [Auriscalpium vulgare]